MRLSDFDFDLPERLIALRPVRPRPASRILVAEGAATAEATVAQLGRWLRPGDMLVFNDTKVLPARLAGTRQRETRDGSGIAKIEVTLIKREGPASWRALAKPAKRLAAGDRIRFGDLEADVVAKAEAGEVALSFSASGADLDAAIALAGAMPLPPYIAQRRPADDADMTDYQTVFATRPGAVAAPTASLHFDDELLDRLAGAGVLSTRLTLHVGAGTFLPVKTDIVDEHKMHAEWGEIPPESAAAINAARAAGGRIIPVGTTALRLIESAAAADGEVLPWVGETDIFIKPGYRFRAVDGLMTNFHLPKSTLFMLVSALMGTARMQEIYATAIERGFRFYSYGDSSLLLPERSL
ncbi:tRNA preQ1(34) S-adenosylmethionine ribosyltransferase-isomerase QueA [Rhodobacteraceae bacterium NNCM2]|nr:tRNA preQ1(34) S-adenosylmethionine ribosyltransferase-isomerase QueA [Coraliihabitans acroporae]